jgi:hypothetical protein
MTLRKLSLSAAVLLISAWVALPLVLLDIYALRPI